MQREREKVDQQLRHVELIVNEHRDRETILKNTLLTAQKVVEDIRRHARKEAATVVKQAELQGDRLLELAQSGPARWSGASWTCAGTHRLRTDIRALVTRLTHLLDLQEEAEVEDNLRFLKRREEASGQCGVPLDLRTTPGGVTLRVGAAARLEGRARRRARGCGGCG